MTRQEKLLQRVASASERSPGKAAVMLQQRAPWSMAAFAGAFGAITLLALVVDLPFPAGLAGGAGGLAMATGLRSFALAVHEDCFELARFRPMSNQVQSVSTLPLDTPVRVLNTGLLQDRVEINTVEYLLSKMHRSQFQMLASGSDLC